MYSCITDVWGCGARYAGFFNIEAAGSTPASSTTISATQSLEGVYDGRRNFCELGPVGCGRASHEHPDGSLLERVSPTPGEVGFLGLSAPPSSSLLRDPVLPLNKVVIGKRDAHQRVAQET
jgi:hypothetical protein